ncbi:glycosyltransferase family 4 protein [Deefgea piscis]|uniref:Glycosyltransferase family 4 protein n=1 Tax=Deefgea piscis TaxID=2739061 RepID=A0A6M8STH1_9NEIS|nr:glycosyltransferase family 4 protein [Deefgea piscis]QKJ66129.1 glycosyltransferase family 4 protein [Deefgea piscis]
MDRIEVNKKIYLIVDPFDSANNGVSAYTRIAIEKLKEFGINAIAFCKRESETLAVFRVRLAEYVKENYQLISLVEVPETLCASMYLPSEIIHIRLHGSKSVGRYYQQLKHDEVEFDLEINEINRAKYVSAPSAATFKSMELFGCKINGAVFPNPTPNFLVKKGSGKVVFLGRGEALKGLNFLPEITKQSGVRLLGDFSLFVFYLKNKKNNWSFRFGTKKQIAKNIGVGDILILPSLFETYSMVAIEAIANGASVIGWSHLGIAEWLPKSMYCNVKAWEVDQFNKEINRLLQTEKVDCEDRKNIISILNDLYVVGVAGLLSDKPVLNFIPDKNILPIPPEGKYLMPVHSKTSRLIRKLMRDPYRYFADSKYLNFLSFLFKPKSDVLSPVVDEKIKKDAVDEVEQKKDTVVESKVEIKEKIITNNSTPTLVKTTTVANVFNIKSVVDFKKSIDFGEIPSSNEKWRAMFLFSDAYLKNAEDILTQCWQHKDFLPLRQKELLYYRLTGGENEDQLQLLNKINLAQKNKLNKVSFVFIFGPMLEHLAAIRSASDSLKVILIVTQDELVKIEDRLADILIDGLIVLAGECENRIKYITKMIESDGSSVSIAIRKFIQDLGPRDIDVFVPVFGKEMYKPELIDAKSGVGIIAYVNNEVWNGRNFKEYCEFLVKNMSNLYVAESIFCTYVDFLKAPDQASMILFIEKALMNGVRIDVRF